jgi:hypothetical protein
MMVKDIKRLSNDFRRCGGRRGVILLHNDFSHSHPHTRTNQTMISGRASVNGQFKCFSFANWIGFAFIDDCAHTSLSVISWCDADAIECADIEFEAIG